MTYSTAQLQQLAITLNRRYPRFGAGLHESAHVAVGMEPEPAREWQPGDLVRHIAPRESARTGRLMVRTFRTQFDAAATIVIDRSERLVWGGSEAVSLKSDLCGYAAEALTQLLLWQGDAVSHIVAGARLAMSEKSKDDAVALRLRGLLDNTPSGDDEQFPRALSTATALYGHAELVIVISDFLADGWERQLKTLALQRDVMAVQVVDPWDFTLPGDIGQQVIDAGSGRLRLKARSRRVQANYAAAAAQQQHAIEATLRQAGARHVLLDNSRPLLNQLVAGMNRMPARKESA